jgi:hypothetical protein
VRGYLEAWEKKEKKRKEKKMFVVHVCLSVCSLSIDYTYMYIAYTYTYIYIHHPCTASGLYTAPRDQISCRRSSTSGSDGDFEFGLLENLRRIVIFHSGLVLLF